MKRLLIFFFTAVIGGGLFWYACGSSSSTTTAPTTTQITDALATNTPYGMSQGKELQSITLPEFSGSATLTYTMTGLPNWLTFDADTRVVSLADGLTTVPQKYETDYDDPTVAYTVTYTASDGTTETSTQFLINDMDGGGVPDGYEYEHGEVPLLIYYRSNLLNDDTITLNRLSTSTPFKIPTGFTVPTVGMDPSDADDDAADFDNDTSSNLDEFNAGTNIFVGLSDASFAAPIQPNVGDGPDGIAVGDFDGDGNLDAAVTNETDDSCSVMFGNGAGNFSLSETLEPGDTPQVPSVGDFNSDGYLDLAVTNNNDDDVSIFINDGDGTFTKSGSDIAVGDGPVFSLASDFDNDNIVDLVVVNTNADSISLLIGNGAGAFNVTQTPDVGDNPGGGLNADLNNDGWMDFAVSDRNDDTMSVLLNDGSGTLNARVTFAACDMPTGGGIGDFDEDGLLDIAAVCFNDGNVNIWLGDGVWTTSKAADKSFSAGDRSMGMAVGDANGDDHLDLFITAMGENIATDTGTLRLFLGAGDGTFTESSTSYDTGRYPIAPALADFNEDGKLDYATTNFSDDNFNVYLNE